MQKFILFLDLIDDQASIERYEKHHENIPEPIARSIKEAGIFSMEIFRFENRLVMEILANDNFSFEKKAKMDENDQDVIEWENLMSTFQKIISNSNKGAKWALGKQIFKL